MCRIPGARNKYICVLYLYNVWVFKLCQQSNFQWNWTQDCIFYPTVNQNFCFSDELDNDLEITTTYNIVIKMKANPSEKRREKWLEINGGISSSSLFPLPLYPFLPWSNLVILLTVSHTTLMILVWRILILNWIIIP